MRCELCEHKILTGHYWWNDKIWIANCKTCKTPMVVWNKHTMDVDEEYVISKVKKIFGKNVRFRKEQRKIKDHFHWHIII